MCGALAWAYATLPAAAQSVAGTGPAVGEKIPGFSALDQHGERRSFANLAGPNGLLLLFHRSADW
jgi:hypothetical protein